MTRRRSDLALDALTWLVVAAFVAPVVWLVLSSLQTNLQIATGTYDFLHPTFDAFTRMWRTVDFERYFVNSLIICTSAALIATAFAACAGYALARFRFRGARPFGLAVIGTQLIPARCSCSRSTSGSCGSGSTRRSGCSTRGSG
jgi:multiple sugar transport system permease protein